jgi:hypothetical protein
VSFRVTSIPCAVLAMLGVIFSAWPTRDDSGEAKGKKEN